VHIRFYRSNVITSPTTCGLGARAYPSGQRLSMLYVSVGESPCRVALDADVEPLPRLSSKASDCPGAHPAGGATWHLFPDSANDFALLKQPLHAWVARSIYQDVRSTSCSQFSLSWRCARIPKTFLYLFLIAGLHAYLPSYPSISDGLMSSATRSPNSLTMNARAFAP
jgi:hypothetical protein